MYHKSLMLRVFAACIKNLSQCFLSVQVFSALALYYINYVVVHYLNGGNSQEVNFFHNYWVILQTIMLPVYIFITYIIIKGSKYNYAETAILQLYLFSMIFLMFIIIHLLKLILPIYKQGIMNYRFS